MSPATHGMAGMVIGGMALKVCPELAHNTGESLFLCLAFLAGQWPDCDLVTLLVLKKETRKKSALYQHRGYGHSFCAHLLYSALSPFLLGCILQYYWQAFLYFFIQVAVHLLLDMIDGSFGIYYLAPLYNKPFACYGIVEDVDDALLNWRPGSRLRLTKRLVFEVMLVNGPILIAAMYVFAK